MVCVHTVCAPICRVSVLKVVVVCVSVCLGGIQ